VDGEKVRKARRLRRIVMIMFAVGRRSLLKIVRDEEFLELKIDLLMCGKLRRWMKAWRRRIYSLVKLVPRCLIRCEQVNFVESCGDEGIQVHF
jgi:hypothetical protein